MRKPRILIVEDNPIVAEDLKIKLLNFGYSISGVAMSGEEALNSTEAQRPDLALMDINLGQGISGLETAILLKEKYGVSVIYLTAHADEQTLDKAKESEPYGFIVKPFDDNDLKSVLEVAIHKMKADLRLRESHQWLQTTLLSIADGVIATDNQGNIRFLNSKAEALTGWESDEAAGQAIETVFCSIDEQSGKVQENPVRMVLQSGGDPTQESESILLSRQNVRIPIKTTSSPIVLSTGETIGAVLVIKDDTRAREAKKELLHQKQRAEMYLNLAGVMFVALDTQGCITLANQKAREVLETEDETIIGLNWFEHFIPEYEQRQFKEAFVKIISGEKAVNRYFENRIVSAKKRVRHIAWNNTILEDESGNSVGMLSSGEDITEKMHLQTRLYQAEKMEAIGTLAGGIAHDFNNLLSSILGFTELSLDIAETGSVMEDNLGEVKSAGLRAKEIVSQILNFARQSDTSIQPVNVGEIAQEAIRLIRSTLPANIKLIQHFNSNSMVMGVASQVHQIFMNLCSNAIHALEKTGGTLQVSVSDLYLTKNNLPPDTSLLEGPHVFIRISDSGSGIAQENLHTIFEPYFTTKGVGKGTGLGLSVVHGIIQEYGGAILVDSKEDRGTSFLLYLPARIEENQELHNQRDSIEPVKGGNEKILFVDDERAICKMSENILTKAGYSVTCCLNGAEAIKLVQANPHHYNLLISDMTMPGTTGDKLAAELLRVAPDLKIILCTGYSSLFDSEALKKLGVSKCIYKPIERKLLLSSVRDVLDESRV